MSESLHNRNPYFTNKQLEELSEYFKTIPVDEEGHPYEPEYNSMAVRSDVLKMISDIWQARRKQYEVEFERDRLRKCLKEAQQAVSDLHHHAESLYQIIQRGDLNTLDLEQADGEYESFCKVIGNTWEHPHLLEGRESIPKEDTR